MPRARALASVVTVGVALGVTACRHDRPAAAPAYPSTTAAPPGRCADLERARVLVGDAERLASVDVSSAIARYDEALTLDPLNDRYLVRLAELHRKRESWEGEARALAAAARIAPDRADYVRAHGTALAKALDGSGVAPRAAQAALQPIFARCLAIDPSMAACEHGLGMAYARAGDDQQALVHLTAAVRKAPEQLGAYLSLSDVYEVVDDDVRATAVLREGLTRAVASPLERVPARIRLAHLLSAAGNHADAVAELEVAKRDDSEGIHPALLFALGYAYTQLSPPRGEDAYTTLRTFVLRACKGALAMRHRVECEVGAGQLAKLGGAR